MSDDIPKFICMTCRQKFGTIEEFLAHRDPAPAEVKGLYRPKGQKW